MTLYLDRDTGEVRDDEDRGGDLISTVEGPPWTLPGDAMTAVKQSFPNENASVSVNDLIRTLEAAAGDVEFGTPPDSS